MKNAKATIKGMVLKKECPAIFGREESVDKDKIVINQGEESNISILGPRGIFDAIKKGSNCTIEVDITAYVNKNGYLAEYITAEKVL